MTISITVRNVPEPTRDELASRAARSGRSLQEYLLHQLIELARRPDIDTVLSRVAGRKEATGSKLTADKILRHRARDRR
jgi:plasmid stability protein